MDVAHACEQFRQQKINHEIRHEDRNSKEISIMIETTSFQTLYKLFSS